MSERFDADAGYDLVTLSATVDLNVALNRGDGAWSSIQTMGLGLSSGDGLAAGRINSDPFADLAIQSADQITIAVSNGAGESILTQTLTPALPGQPARSGGLPVGLTFGLFDQNLSTDLAVVVPGTNELLVYRGLGLSNGSFGTPTRYASGGTEPVAVVTGQFVGSTDPDLAVAHRDGTITFFAGDGSGSFSLHSGKKILAANGISPASIESITVDDFNGDGESDLAITATDMALLLLNAGDTLKSSPIDRAQTATTYFSNKRQCPRVMTLQLRGNSSGRNIHQNRKIGGNSQKLACVFRGRVASLRPFYLIRNATENCEKHFAQEESAISASESVAATPSHITRAKRKHR